MPPELTDIRSGDYRIPDLRLESTEQRPLNKYGQTFPREHRPVQYSLLTMLQKLFPRMEQGTSVKAAAPPVIRHTNPGKRACWRRIRARTKQPINWVEYSIGTA